MPSSNVVFQNLFPGAGYPSFAVEWPDFSWPTGNPTGWTKPVVDGHDHGMASRTLRASSAKPWRAKSDFYPGGANYKADLEFRFSDAANGTDTIGLIVRFIDYQNFIVARVTAGVTPTVKLYKVVGGTATQLGSTYTGTGFSSTDLFSGVKLRVRIEDRATDTRITLYRGSTDTDNGTSIIDQTIDVASLRGAYTAGIELYDTQNDRVAVTSLTVRDFADEWAPSDADPGAGIKVEIGGIMYSVDDLAALVPSVQLVEVKHGYGLSGMEATLEVQGDYRMGSVVFPGQKVRVFEDGTCRFSGWVYEASASASARSEIQTFTCRDARWRSKSVILAADDKTGSHYFNVYATGVDGATGACSGTVKQNYPDEYDPDLQNMTIGDIVKWLFDRYIDGDFGLRYYGCATPSENPYVQAELDALTAVLPDIAVHGTFPQAIDALMKYMPMFQIIVDPETGIWHFVDMTSLSADTVQMPAECVPSLKISPDPDKSITAVVWRGTKKQDADAVELSLSEGSLVPAWTQAQEDVHSDAKKNLTTAQITVAAAGTLTNYVLNGKTYLSLDYVDITLTESQTLQVDPDDWRGSTVSILGVLRVIISNTATRFYLSPPNWGSPPTLGTKLTLSYADECAQEGLGAAGVGRGYYIKTPGVICGIADTTANLYSRNMKNKGFCGTATVVATGYGAAAVSFQQQYEYRVKQMTAEMQQAFGVCDPLLLIAKPVEIPLGLVNFGMLPPSKGSAPKTACQPNKAVPPGIDLKVVLSMTESEAAYQRWPAVGFRGEAFSEDASAWNGGGQPRDDDWKVENTLVIDDPDFKSLAIQGPGILEAQKAIVSMFGQKSFAIECEIAAGWTSDDVDLPMRWSRFGLLGKKLRFSSTERTTGFESVDNLPVYEVRWRVKDRKTVLRAGTPVAWSNIDPKSLASTFVDKNILKKIYQKMKEVEDFRNAVIAHSSSRAGPSALNRDGCTVIYSNTDTRRFSDVNTTIIQKDRKVAALGGSDQLAASLLFKRDADNPGSKIEIPGLTDIDSKMPIRSAAVLESAAQPWQLEQGPTGVLNSDRSRYGGLTGRDETVAGDPPTELGRFGGYSFRLKPDVDGNPYGGDRLQFAVLDSHGAPGSYVDFNGPESMPTQHVPLAVIGVGTLLHTMLSRIIGVEKNTGTVADATSELTVAPGDVTTDYPDGAPATLVDTAVAMAAFAGSQIVPGSLRDPGGPVFSGPRTDDGVDSQTFWRVAMPERVVYQVEADTPGSGENGGAWSAVIVDDARVYASGGSLYHKQAHAAELDADRSGDLVACSTTPTLDDSPFAFANARGRTLDANDLSGAGTIFPLPKGAVGIPIFEASLAEVPGDVTANGDVHEVYFTYSYKASAWSTATDTAVGTGLTGDGSGEVVGRYLHAGGEVPPGLRVPSDTPSLLGVSVRRDPGAGGDTAGGTATSVVGIGVTVAVINGGIWIRIRDGCAAADAVVHNHPQAIDSSNIDEVVSLELNKALPESVGIGDSMYAELNPPLVLYEEAAADDAVVLDATKVVSDGAGAHDSVLVELNP